jgi:hypothetical protein
MAVIKTSKKIKGKLEDRGLPCVYLGQARDHAGDTYRFLNLATKMVLVSRDVIWLDQVYGEFTGNHDILTSMIASLANLNMKAKDKEPGRVEPTVSVDPSTAQDATADPDNQLMSPSKNTRSSGLQPLDANEIKPHKRALKVLCQLGGVSWNSKADALADKIGVGAAMEVEPDRALIAMSGMALVDRF